jgi:ABC-type multidrug transport system ATPase subunit
MASQSAFEIEGIPERVMVMEKGRIILDESVDTLKQKFVKFYGESIPSGIPVVFSRQWQNAREMYVYPYQPEIHRLDGVEHLNLTEILRAFIGGEYARH